MGLTSLQGAIKHHDFISSLLYLITPHMTSGGPRCGLIKYSKNVERVSQRRLSCVVVTGSRVLRSQETRLQADVQRYKLLVLI